MAVAERGERFVIQIGSKREKHYPLKKPAITIGADSKCDLVLNGSYVSPTHATAEKGSDGRWVLENQSVNGTLVNGARIDKAVLQNGDTIQMGTEARLQFESVESARKPTPAEQETGQTDGKEDAGGSRVKINPFVAMGLGVYLSLLAGVAVYLGMMDSEKLTVLSFDDVRESIQATRQQLGLDGKDACGASVEGRLLTLDSHADSAADYYRLLALKQSSGKSQAIEDQIDTILHNIREHLFRAWQMESQGRTEDAQKEYVAASRTLPDIRCPITRLVMKRISKK